MRGKMLWLFLTLFASGCSLAPEYRQPQQDIPDSWGRRTPAERSSELDCAAPEVEYAVLSRQWWKRFQDKALDSLVEQALAHNRDIAQGLARVDQARAALMAARGELFPAVDAQGSGMRSRPSLRTSETSGLEQELMGLEERVRRLEGMPMSPSSLPSRTGTVWSGNVQAVWELDIWGRWRNAAASAREELLSAEETQRALELTMAGQVCAAYFELLNCDAQLELTEKTLESRRKTAELYERQYAAGAMSELDILNVRTQLDSLRDSLAQVRIQREQAESALLLLTGAEPSQLYVGRAARGVSLAELPAVPQIPEGLPSELLIRRPDIVSAEAELRAAHFQLGAARAAFFPSISLTGSLGVESTQLGSLFSGASQGWSFGGTASWSLLSFGRTLGSVRQSEAALRGLASSYEKTVQQAFGDIRNALAAQQGMAESARSLEEAAERMAQAATLVQKRYAEGYTPYLDVLEAERTLYSAQMQFLARRKAQLTAIVQVCVALGGGW